MKRTSLSGNPCGDCNKQNTVLIHLFRLATERGRHYLAILVVTVTSRTRYWFICFDLLRKGDIIICQSL